jgi:predicted nucleic acid-binding protein
VLVVDTSVWVDFLNGHRSLEAEYLATCLTDDVPIALPGLVRAEILAGLRTDAEAGRIASLLEAFDAAPEPATADYVAAGGLYRSCRRVGAAVGSLVDCLIAQTCLSHGHALLTKDRDFHRIALCTQLRLIECN